MNFFVNFIKFVQKIKQQLESWQNQRNQLPSQDLAPRLMYIDNIEMNTDTWAKFFHLNVDANHLVWTRDHYLGRAWTWRELQMMSNLMYRGYVFLALCFFHRNTFLNKPSRGTVLILKNCSTRLLRNQI